MFILIFGIVLGIFFMAIAPTAALFTAMVLSCFYLIWLTWQIITDLSGIMRHYFR